MLSSPDSAQNQPADINMIDECLVQFAANAIVHYLQTHPDSADTTDGIHQWWIQWPGLPESVLVTNLALERLERAALIERRQLSNREVWRLPQSTPA